MQFCGLCRIFNILPKLCPQESNISQFLVLPVSVPSSHDHKGDVQQLTPAFKMQMNHCHCIPAGYSFHSPGTSLPEDKIWTLGFVILFYYTEYCHFKRHIQQSSKCSCHLVPVVWQLFLAKSLLPFSTHKLWVLSWWCHQKTVITESCKKWKKKESTELKII